MLLALLGAFVASCAGTQPKYPQDALRLSESALEIRSIQTRKFEVSDESVILAASIGVLQDMEFNIDEIERPLGVLTASKVIDADSAEEKVGLFIMDVIIGGGYMQTASDEEKIIVTLVVLPSLERENEYTARFTLQRVVFDQLERIKLMGVIGNPEIYQDMFEKLSKSIFLETSQQ
ncbi:MAG: hypothetical protein JSV45_08170 [Chromatiales bacterium]|nr:MAG: hypothetical protein JSV45_08170 [Chromatiales bacterium]